MDKHFLAFCEGGEPYSCYWKLAEPFVQKGWLYATDGRAAVRVKTRRTKRTQNTPSMERVFPPVFPVCDIPWPKVPKNHPMKKCENCGGDIPEPIMVGPIRVAGLLHRRIARLGGVKYCPVPAFEGCLAFTARGGIQGLVIEIVKSACCTE